MVAIVRVNLVVLGAPVGLVIDLPPFPQLSPATP
jgi:hypothetical protein